MFLLSTTQSHHEFTYPFYLVSILHQLAAKYWWHAREVCPYLQGSASVQTVQWLWGLPNLQWHPTLVNSPKALQLAWVHIWVSTSFYLLSLLYCSMRSSLLGLLDSKLVLLVTYHSHLSKLVKRYLRRLCTLLFSRKMLFARTGGPDQQIKVTWTLRYCGLVLLIR
jgi:hypothetical protein